MSDTNLLNWTDLPKEIGPDFISHNKDYDFPLYLSEKEEWINLKNIKHKGRITISEPFLIMELNRFVPYLGDKRVKFHALNMPYVKIGKIEIMGFVIGVSEDARFYEYQVDDGTGTVRIFYEKKLFEITVIDRKKIDDKYSRRANKVDIKLLKSQECPNSFSKQRPNFKYPDGTSIRDKMIFEHNWSLETNNGTLGKKIKRCAYVHATGYCTLDFLHGKRPTEEITFKDLSNAKLNFIATKVTRISEHEYNKKLLSWLYTVVQRRYNEHPTEPELFPKIKNSKAPAGCSKVL